MAPRSSTGKISAWFVVLAGLALYVGLVYGLAQFRVPLDIRLPWWAIQLAPAVLYAVLAMLCMRRASAVGWLFGTIILCGAHVLVGMGTVLLYATFDPAAAGPVSEIVLRFPPPLPQVLWVPLLLVPLRDLWGRGRGRAAALERACRAAARRQAARPRSSELEGLRASGVTGSAGESSVRAGASAADPLALASVSARQGAAGPLVMAAAEPGETASAWPPSLLDHAALPPREGMVRIPFARVAEQFPPEAFALPLHRVGAELPDPDHLLVPRATVVSQLPEGVVRVAWQDIASQFPDTLLAISAAEMIERLRFGLRLPLDEIIRQLPPELYTPTGKGPDLSSIESVPPPFGPSFKPSGPAAAAVEPLSPAPFPGVQEMVAEVPGRAAAAAAKGGAAELAVAPEPAEAEAPAAAPVVPTVPPAADRELIRIAWEKVAAQFPPDAFLLPLERIGANLIEPGHLRVARDLVLPQLAEGLVRIKWEDLAPQFPRHLLAIPATDLVARLPEGRLSLPMQDVIRQLPLELFTPAGPGPDLSGIESVPAPFQPFEPEPLVTSAPVEPIGSMACGPAAAAEERSSASEAVGGAVVAAGAAASAAPEAGRAATEDLERRHEPAGAAAEPDLPEIEPTVLGEALPAIQPEPPGPEVESPVPAREAIERLPEHEAELAPGVPSMVGISTVLPEPALMEPLETELQRGIEGRGAAAGEPAWAIEPPAPPAPAAVEPVASPLSPAPAIVTGRPVPAGEDLAAVRRIAAALAPLSVLDVGVEIVDGVTLYTLCAPGLPHDMAAAGLFVPLLADWRLSCPPEQVTLRGPETALVLTPLRSGGRVLAAALPKRGSLALLEILCRRAAADSGEGSDGAASALGGGKSLPDFAELQTSPRLALASAMLGSFGPIAATALADASGEHTLYLFLPPGRNARAAGAFALDLGAAIRKAAGAGVAFRTVVLRSGCRVMVVRPEETAPGRSTTVVVAGETTRPGLAYRQAEQAFAALGIL
jgi:hypothetical protein